MSKERARRREAREAMGAPAGPRRPRRATSSRPRAESALARRRPHRWRPPGFGSGRFTRRTRTQRATIGLILLAVVLMIWFVAEDWGVRVGLTLAALIAAPALITLALGRSNR